jgi:hypothetical protein
MDAFADQKRRLGLSRLTTREASRIFCELRKSACPAEAVGRGNLMDVDHRRIAMLGRHRCVMDRPSRESRSSP